MGQTAVEIIRSVLLESETTELSQAAQLVIDRMPVADVLHTASALAFESHDEDVQDRAYRVILRLSSIDIIPFLFDLYARDEALRYAICEDMARFPDPRVQRKLVDILLHESNANVRLMAAWSLGEIGTSAALEALEYAAMHDDGEDYETLKVADIAHAAAMQIRTRTLIEDDIGR